MIDLITAYVHFAMQGPQEFCLACVPFGLAGMFTGKLPTVRAYEPPKTRRKKRKGNARKSRTVAGKSRPQKAQGEPAAKVKEWYKAPPMTAEQHERVARYYAGRDRIKQTSTSAGQIPL